MARRLTKFATILGLLLLAYGVGWLLIWDEGAQAGSGLDWPPLDLSPPVEPRLMVVGGALLLLVASLTWLFSRLAAGKTSVKDAKL